MNTHTTWMCLLLWAIPLAILAQAPSTDGLIAYWKFDEASGSTASNAAGGNNATLNPGASFGNTQGQSGGALVLNGTTGVATVPSFDIGGSATTIAAWVFPVSQGPSATGGARIISKASSSAEYFMIKMDTPRSFQLRLRLNDKGYTFSAPANVIQEDAWNHIAFTYNGSQVKLYHNGVLLNTSSATGTLTPGPGVNLGIGNRPAHLDQNRPFEGKIDELRVYNRSLSDSEIAGLTTPAAYQQLPVTFTAFSATSTRSGITLDWTVEDQIDNAGFAVERAVDQQAAFTEIGFVAAHAYGRYAFTDHNVPAGTVYYRLRQEDFDGTVSYSDVIRAQGQTAAPLAVYPNPTSDVLTIRGNGDYLIMDALGRRMAIGAVAGQQTISVGSLPQGTYTLWVNQDPVRFVKR